MEVTSLASLPELLRTFAVKAPMAVITRLILQSQLSSDYLDTVFEKHAESQYTHQLTFSAIARLLTQVVLGQQPTVHAAYLAAQDRQEIAVSVTAVYDKLSRTELRVCESLVRDSAERLHELLMPLRACHDEPIPGYRLRTLDGNHLGPCQRRLQPLRGQTAAALPGQSLVLHDYATGLISEMVACEDAHAHERKYLPQMMALVRPGDCIMGDRAFSTRELLDGLHFKQAGYLIRRHGTMPYRTTGKRHYRGKCSTGRVYEQTAEIEYQGRTHRLRAITIIRRKPLQHSKKQTRKGKKPGNRYRVVILTNLPASALTAVRAARLYLKRWRIEEAFRKLTQVLKCEVKTLGYPKAALLAFSLAVMAFNTLVCVQGSLASVHGMSKVTEEVSFYHIALEVRRTYDGMEIAINDDIWAPYATMTPTELAQVLQVIVKQVNLKRYPLKKRGPKKRKGALGHEPDNHLSVAKKLAVGTP